VGPRLQTGPFESGARCRAGPTRPHHPTPSPLSYLLLRYPARQPVPRRSRLLAARLLLLDSGTRTSEGPTAARAPTTRTALSYSGPALGPPAGADAGYAPLHVRTHTNGTRMQARTNTQTDTRTRGHTHLKPSLTARTAVPHLPRRPSLGCWAWRMKTSNLVDRSCHATGHRHIRPGPRAGTPVGLTCRACCLSTLPSPKLAPAPRGKLAGAQHPLGPLLSQRLQWKRPGTATGGKARSSRAGQRER
jgi:hypothetical protein